MVSWVLIAFVVLFPLAQVPLVIYIGRYVKLREGERPARPPVRDFWDEDGDAPGDPEVGPDDANAAPDDASIPHPDPAPDEVTCPECGSWNDAGFRYCGDCAASLTPAAD